jgi:hypothetical protein
MTDHVAHAIQRFRHWMRTSATPVTEAELDAFVARVLEESRARPLTPRQRTRVERALADVRQDWARRMFAHFRASGGDVGAPGS